MRCYCIVKKTDVLIAYYRCFIFQTDQFCTIEMGLGFCQGPG